ncbi:MAG: hypothetical protein LBQ77_03860 [Treponema sp.]|jgi:hypothetical protein|nr:hypothetical protein [Treponema sp.]
MKKSLYFGIVTLFVAMSVVFIACKDDEDEPAGETFTDVSGISLPQNNNAAKVNANLKIDSAKKSNTTELSISR